MIDGNIDIVTLTGQITDTVSLEGELLPIGPKGDQGDPGFSPVVTTSKSGKTTTVKFETATGNVYAYIQDGEDGQGSGDMMTDVYDQNKNGIVDNAEKVNGKTVETNVPASAIFTDENAVWGNITGTLSNQTDLSTALGNKVNTSSIGVASGIAELDENGKVPSSQLPSYVDDVIEGYYYNSKFYQDLSHTIEITGEAGKIYVDLVSNKTYRWGGTEYAEISSSLALGETNSTAYRGDRGKTAYDHSQTTSGNPHNVTKSDIGLGNEGNFKAVSTEANQGLSSTEKSNARTNIGAGTSSFSGSYNDLSNKPTIPTKTSELTNDENFISEVDIQDNLLNVYTSVDTDYRVNFLSSRNLFDITSTHTNNHTTDTTIDNKITITNEGNWARVRYPNVPLQAGTYTLNLKYTNSSNSTIRLYAYKLDGTTLITSTTATTSASGTETLTFTITENGACIDLYSNASANGSTAQVIFSEVMIEKGDIASPYEEYIQKTINVDDTKFTDTINVGIDINTANRVNVLHSKNLFNKSTITPNMYIDASGNLVNDNSNFVSDYILIDNTKDYYASQNDGGFIRVAYYTSDKTYISRQTESSNTLLLTIPNNAYYVRLSCFNVSLDTLQLEQGNTASTYEPYITTSINVDGEEIYNANIMTYDSAERVIGTWFGKPLYRKVFTITTETSFPYNTWVALNSIILSGGVNRIINCTYTALNNAYTMPLVAYRDSSAKLNVLNLRNTTVSSSNFEIILEYTKTS